MELRAPIEVHSPGLSRMQNKRRLGLLKSRQAQKMARSAHAYMRGSTAKFYEWLEEQRPGSVPEGPPIWICGDCHAGNLGPLADADERVRVQMRDFDQTVVGNPCHDIIRLALSLTTASRSANLPGVMAARMMEALLEGYQEALHSEEDLRDMPSTIRLVVRRSARRTWKQLAVERIKDARPKIPLGKKFLAISKEERRRIDSLVASDPIRELICCIGSRERGCKVDTADAAYWIKGCSSLGLLHYAVLVEIAVDRSVEYALIDIKEAGQALAPRYTRAQMPKSNATRVVEGARALSPHFGQRMAAAQFGRSTVFVRELMPQDLKFEFETMERDEAADVAHYLASVVGKAHARQLDAADRRAWLRTLSSRKSRSLTAPNWLWQSVVSLVAAHEGAYLDHCRRYALG